MTGSILTLSVHAVPVVVRSMPPAPTSPGSDPWEQSAVVIALITMVVAVVTLLGVLRQIKVANDNLTLSQLELQTTRESNELVRQDLQFSRTQADFVSRKATLSLHQNEQRIEHAVKQFRSREPYVHAPISLWIFNDGNKTARDAKVSLWLPYPEWKVSDWDGIHNPKVPFAAQGLTSIKNVEIERKRHWLVTVDLSSPTYPNVPYIAHTFMAVLPLPYEGDLLWQIGYDDGIAPDSEPYGRIRFRIVRKPNA